VKFLEAGQTAGKGDLEFSGLGAWYWEGELLAAPVRKCGGLK